MRKLIQWHQSEVVYGDRNIIKNIFLDRTLGGSKIFYSGYNIVKDYFIPPKKEKKGIDGSTVIFLETRKRIPGSDNRIWIEAKRI